MPPALIGLILIFSTYYTKFFETEFLTNGRMHVKSMHCVYIISI